jgi:hypothetical protein
LLEPPYCRVNVLACAAEARLLELLSDIFPDSLQAEPQILAVRDRQLTVAHRGALLLVRGDQRECRTPVRSLVDLALQPVQVSGYTGRRCFRLSAGPLKNLFNRLRRDIERAIDLSALRAQKLLLFTERYAQRLRRSIAPNAASRVGTHYWRRLSSHQIRIDSISSCIGRVAIIQHLRSRGIVPGSTVTRRVTKPKS